MFAVEGRYHKQHADNHLVGEHDGAQNELQSRSLPTIEDVLSSSDETIQSEDHPILDLSNIEVVSRNWQYRCDGGCGK